MKKILIALLILAFLAVAPHAYAHMPGQPSFFSINGAYSILYPVLSSSTDYGLPQDAAPQSYLVGRAINFEIDTTQLSAPADAIQKTVFTWDFGDGTHAKGLRNTHAYAKPGSFVVTIMAQYVTDPQPQLFETVLLNVLHSASYTLPKGVIRIDEKEQPKDSTNPFMYAPLGRGIDIDASASELPSRHVVSYFWDLGDGQTSTEKTIHHAYKENVKEVTIDLRIKDDMGFISDVSVVVQNKEQTGDNFPSSASLSSLSKKGATHGSVLKIVFVGIVICLGGAFLVYIVRKRYFH